jgi:hypothetical protein
VSGERPLPLRTQVPRGRSRGRPPRR